jgi:hypothetical protein
MSSTPRADARQAAQRERERDLKRNPPKSVRERQIEEFWAQRERFSPRGTDGTDTY